MKLLPSRFYSKEAATRRRLGNSLRLPAELLVEIASHLTWATDVLNFSLTSSQLRTILLPEMYKSVFLFGGAWFGALELFATRPELSVHIRRLSVDHLYEALRPEHWQEEPDIDRIARSIEKASAGFLNLQTFTWCGKQLPPDPLLRALRDTCPKLKNLHCLAKVITFDPASELFKFDDLTGFTLWVAYDEKTREGPSPMQDIPVELGDMLLQRCPNLDSLSIRLRSMPNLWIHEPELDRLLSGVWPKLRTLHLDIEIIDSTPILFWPPVTTLARFLSMHSSITELMLAAYAILPTTVFSREIPSCLEPNPSCQLTSFEGLVQHAAELPNPTTLKALVLTTVITETYLAPIVAVLRNLPSLRELTVEFSDIDASTATHEVVSACPNLTSLHTKFYTTTFTSKEIKELSAQFRYLSQLRSLQIDKVYSATEGTMLKTALLLLGDSPLLQDICILNFRANHWCQRGHYLIVTGTKGRKFITARETGLERFYPRGKLLDRVYPKGKFNRGFRYSLEKDVLGSISKKFKRMRQ